MSSLPTLLRPIVPAACRRALKWDSISAVLSGLFSGAVGPFFGVIARQDMHASNFWLAMLSSSGSAGNLLNPLVAHHIRKKPKLPYIVWPMALARVVFFFVPLALSAPLFIMIGFANSFIGTLSGPASHAFLRDAYPAERRGRLMSFVRVLAVLGGLAGAALGGRLLMHYDYKLIFPLMAFVGLLSVAAFTRVGVGCHPEEDAPPQMGFWESVAIVRKDPAFKLYCTFFYLYGFGNMMAGPIITMVQVDQLHITKQWVSYLSITQAIFGMLGYFLWGKVVDHRGPVSPDVRRARRAHALPPHLLPRPQRPAAAHRLLRRGTWLGRR